MNCHWKCCKSAPDTEVYVRIPKDSDARLAKGGSIYLCPKHIQTLKFWLDIKPQEEKNEEIQAD